MTTTILHSGGTTRTTPSAADLLRALVDDALSVAADDDADRFDGGTRAGHALLSLAGLARRAAGALGADPGITITAAPGVVVVRELAAAARLLDSVASRDGGTADLDGLLATAKGVHARLHEVVASAA
jgi:hypothetical protein